MVVAAVTPFVRIFTMHADGQVFESRSRQTLVSKTPSDSAMSIATDVNVTVPWCGDSLQNSCTYDTPKNSASWLGTFYVFELVSKKTEACTIVFEQLTAELATCLQLG